MPKIPKVAEVNQPKAMIGKEKELLQQVATEQLKRNIGKNVMGNPKKVDVTFQLGNPNVNKVEVTTAHEVNQLLLQKTFGGLSATTNVLEQVQGLIKLLSNPRVRPETKKDIQSQILTLLKEVEHVALKTKIGNINLLGKFDNKPIQLVISDDGKRINMRTYDLLKDVNIIREFVNNASNERTLERLIERTGLMQRHIEEYKVVLRNVATRLDIELDFKANIEVYGNMSSAEASKMSDTTRAIILSAYGVTFFSQFEKKAKEFLTSPLGFFIIICLIVILILWNQVHSHHTF